MFDPQQLAQVLDRLAAVATPPARYLVACSGGLDSSVLLHALRSAVPTLPLAALHVNHGLHADSGHWAQHAAEQARRLGIDFECRAVSVDTDAGTGPEAAARAARYTSFESCMQVDDWLLTAQHQDDQAETLLLNLLRGSGPRGLAAMPAVRPFGPGWLVRPLLEYSRAELLQYAQDAGIDWLDDPSNQDRGLDRNYLRHEILPAMRRRWPAAARRIARSAALAGDASQLLDELASEDLSRCATESRYKLALGPIAGMTLSRRRNLVRQACRVAGLGAPPERSLQAIVTSVVDAGDDRCPVVAWRGGEVRRYRDTLYLSTGQPRMRPAAEKLRPGKPVNLGPGHGTLALEPGAGTGMPAAVAERGLTVQFRQGGESLRPDPNGHRRPLKTLFQEAGILPWMRPRIPLLWSDDRLVAVGDLWLDAAFREPGGYCVRWRDRPAVN